MSNNDNSNSSGQRPPVHFLNCDPEAQELLDDLFGADAESSAEGGEDSTGHEQ